MRPRATVVLIVAAVAAGGLAALAQAAHPPPKHWQVVTLKVQGKSFSYAEPAIVAGPSGKTMAVIAAGAGPGVPPGGVPPTLWISHDGGQSWSVGRDFDSTGYATGDADALVAPGGYLYAVNLGYNPNPHQSPNTSFLAFRSSNGGHTWSGPAKFPQGALQEPDRPWLVVNPRNRSDVDMVSSQGGRNVVIWRSVDHGATFTGPGHVSPNTNSVAGVALSSRPLFDPTQANRMFTVYETAAKVPVPHGRVYEIPFTQIWLATSTDAGQKWSRRVVFDTSRLHGPLAKAVIGHTVVVSAVDRQGNLYVAFSLRRQGETRTAVYFMYSANKGRTWSAALPINSPMASNVMPALAISPHGTAYLSWYGSTSASFSSSHATWREMFAQSSNPLGSHPHFKTVQVSGSQPVHVGPINTAGGFGAETGANWGLRDFQGVIAGPCGAPRLVWADDNGVSDTQTATPAGACH